jgi:hypothetical protein
MNSAKEKKANVNAVRRRGGVCPQNAENRRRNPPPLLINPQMNIPNVETSSQPPRTLMSLIKRPMTSSRLPEAKPRMRKNVKTAPSCQCHHLISIDDKRAAQEEESEVQEEQSESRGNTT